MRTSWSAIIIGLLWFSSAVDAATVDVFGDDPRKVITVVVENSSVDQILKEFASRYGFRIKGVQNVGVGELLSQKMSGRLDEVVGRLLRNWNHMVVRSPDSPCGIEAVMILNGNYGTGPAKPTQMPVDEGDLLKGAGFAF